MRKWRFDSDLKKQNGNFCRFQIQVLSMPGRRCKRRKKHENKQIRIAKNRKLATQNLLFNMHIYFPFGNIKRLSLLWKIRINMILWNISIVCFIIELHQFTSGTPYIPQICTIGRSLYHNRNRIVAVSRTLQIYTESTNPIRAVFSWVFGVFFLQHNVYFIMDFG